MTELLYKEITFDIRGACFEVWKELGGAFKEKTVERALAMALKKRGRKVETQKNIPIIYQGSKIGSYVPDQVVDEKVLVEIKCKEFITSQDYDQFWKYLKGSNYKVGLLINFGPEGLQIKRTVYELARSAYYPRKQSALNPRNGFTLIEVVVATTIFAVVATAMMALFNYTLKINRRAEAVRQATQGIRNFTEFVVKIVRNGQIDYAVKPDLSGPNTQVGQCPVPTVLGSDTYGQKENRLGLFTPENERWCLFLGDANGIYVNPGNYSGETLVLQKETGQKEILNPPYFKIENLMFLIRPLENPYYTGPGGLIRTQPFVAIIMKAVAQLPTGEKQDIYYQTTVSSDKYDIPNN